MTDTRPPPPSRRSARLGPPSGPSSPKPRPGRHDEERLLAALGRPGAEARPDPDDAARLLVRTLRGAVSVAAGRFPRTAGDSLARQDLAAWDNEGGASPVLRLAAPGAARLRRAAADPETAFREQHSPSETRSLRTPDGPRRVRVDPEESPLDWLRRRRGRDGAPLIDEAASAAGERLRRDITAAALLPSVTAKWDAVRVKGGPRGPAEATDRAVAARQRVRRACEALGADFADLLIDLCGFLKGLETIERERGWPPRSAKVVVRLALARLAEHYGLASAATGAASRRIRSWQALVDETDGGGV